MAQVVEIASIVIVVGGLSFVFFKVLNALKLLRSAPADELMGLDMPEMGMPGYTNGGCCDARRPAVATGSSRVRIADSAHHSQYETSEAMHHDQEN